MHRRSWQLDLSPTLRSQWHLKSFPTFNSSLPLPNPHATYRVNEVVS